MADEDGHGVSGKGGGRPGLPAIMGYALGEGAGSLVMNSINGFALLFYTDALGLPAGLAGLALSLAIFWDAITDPVMGYVSDTTRSRYGRRHPYILLGGLAMAGSFYMIWAVPEAFRGSDLSLFWYLVIMNMALRTAVTVYVVPYVALGFEVCTEYQDRSRLQGVKFAASMLANFLGPALAWRFFFADTETVKGTSVASNFNDMAGAFTFAVVILVLLTVWVTRGYRADSRSLEHREGRGVGGFLKEMGAIVSERYPRLLFSAVTVYIIGVVMVGSLQMYVYVHFMGLTSDQKVVVHGMGMLSGGVGAILAPILSKWVDKRRAAMLGIGASITSSALLWLIFITAGIQADWSIPVGGFNLPAAIILFTACQGLFWGGNAVLQPITYSMIADVSQVHAKATGILRDGSYSAMLSLIYKVAIALGMAISGFAIAAIGYQTDLEVQRPEVIKRLMQAMCLGGGLIPVVAALILQRYPIDRAFMERLES